MTKLYRTVLGIVVALLLCLGEGLVLSTDTAPAVAVARDASAAYHRPRIAALVPRIALGARR